MAGQCLFALLCQIVDRVKVLSLSGCEEAERHTHPGFCCLSIIGGGDGGGGGASIQINLLHKTGFLSLIQYLKIASRLMCRLCLIHDGQHHFTLFFFFKPSGLSDHRVCALNTVTGLSM